MQVMLKAVGIEFHVYTEAEMVEALGLVDVEQDSIIVHYPVQPDETEQLYSF